MPRLLLALLAMALLPITVLSAQQDFAYRARLEQADQPLQRVALPLDVILALTRADLGDIAVFNADGKQLVHTVLRAPAPVRELSRDLPFHEFSRFQQQHSKTVTTREQNQQGGSLSELETTQTVPVQTSRNDYLVELDVDGSSPAYQHIDLQWVHEPAQQILELRVEIGNELDSLRVFRPRKSLTNLESKDRSWRSIEDIPPGHRYLRLTPLNSVSRFELQRVTAHYRETDAAPDLDHRMATQRIDDGETIYYRIDYPSKVPAESLRIVPATANSVLSGQLYASRGEADELTLIRSDIRQHNIDAAGLRPSEPVKLARQAYRYIAFSSTEALSAAPSIELIYPQYELLFLGDGKGPYTLAWGNFESGRPAGDLTAILQDGLQQAQQQAVAVTLGAIEESGGQSRLAPRPALPWRKWLLWTLLIVAVIVTARMAMRLYREMNATP